MVTCNSPSPQIAYPLWAFPFGLPLKVYKTHLLGRGFHTLIKNVSFSSPTDVGSHNPPSFRASVLASTRPILQSMWDSPIHPLQDLVSLLAHYLLSTPLQGSTSSLAHCPVSGSYTICNSPSPPLADIVLFWFFLSGSPLKFLKRIC